MDPGTRELSRESIKIGQFLGKQLVVEVPRGNGQFIMRNYRGHGRLYVVMAGGRGFRPGQENVNRLIDSFEILDTGEPDAPAPPPDPGPDPPGPRPPGPAAPPTANPWPAFTSGWSTFGLPRTSTAVCRRPSRALLDIPSWLHAAAYSPDGRLLLTASEKGRLLLLDPAALSRRMQFVTDSDGPSTALAFRPTGSEFAVGRGNRIRLFDLGKLKR